MSAEKCKMQEPLKSGNNKGLQGCEDCMFEFQKSFESTPISINVDVNLKLEPFGTVQKKDTIHIDQPPAEDSSHLKALPVSTLVTGIIR